MFISRLSPPQPTSLKDRARVPTTTYSFLWKTPISSTALFLSMIKPLSAVGPRRGRHLRPLRITGPVRAPSPLISSSMVRCCTLCPSKRNFEHNGAVGEFNGRICRSVLLLPVFWAMSSPLTDGTVLPRRFRQHVPPVARRYLRRDWVLGEVDDANAQHAVASSHQIQGGEPLRAPLHVHVCER